ncbi:helix-turn-helix transcriptional regulator [Polaribacter cellanae]|uniref:Helix-turn-helix transcriptional regulator n=1 Tax=Polaribacter cellanae TaxID=2818493 RepID=A0A975CNC3_9FLAO|nr:helix-turn-helix transcriptional regulator [Polaribacter cellanae]QTE22390.1 helix-turn-helix transcriptional regulator [Polaribacter cellanae]
MSLILREIRKKYSLTQSEFAVKLGVTRSAISQIELGRNELSMSMAKKISKLFEVSLRDLIEDNHAGISQELYKGNDIHNSIYGQISLIPFNIDQVEIVLLTIDEFCTDKKLKKEFVLSSFEIFVEASKYEELIKEFYQRESNKTLNLEFVEKVTNTVSECYRIALIALFNVTSFNYKSIERYYKK